MSETAAGMDYDLHGVGIRVTCPAPRLAARLRAFLAHLGLEAAAAVAPPDLELEVTVGEPPQLASDAAWEPVAGMGISVVRRGLPLAARSAQAVVSVEPERGRAVVVVAPAQAAAGSLHMNLVSYALLSLLRQRELYPLHAAGTAWGGVGLLVVADSGAGKSTLAAALLFSGWSVVSDDSLLLTPVDGGVAALALRRDLFLHPDAGLVSEGLDGGPWPEVGKVRLSPRVSSPELAAERCTPRVLVFPELVDQPRSRLEPCAAETALHLLAHHGLVAELPASGAARHLALLAELVRRCSAHRLLAASDLVEDRGLAARLLAPLCENAGEAS